MMPASRTPEEEFILSVKKLGDDPASTDPDRQVDPARAASILAIHRALAAQQTAARTLQGIVIIEVPSPDWAEPVSSAWEDVVGSQANIRKASTYNELDARPNEWLIFRADGTDRRYSADRDNEQVARCLWQGENLLGVSHLPDRYLPSNLVRAADLRLVLNPLDADGLAIVAQSVTNGTPTAFPPPEVCAVLSPLILRLARRQGQSADDFLQRAQRIAEQQAPSAPHAGLSLDFLPGMDAAVAWGRDLARDLKLYSAGRLGWRDIDRGCLLAGPPGTGKTTFAKALAASCGVPLIWASYSRWQSSEDGHLGDLLRAMALSFDQARKAAPCILFIDELDTFHNRHGDSGHRDWWAAIIGGLLEHLDGIEGREGVVVVGATNYPDIVDPAIIRSGRLDRTIMVPLPDLTALMSILRVHLGDDLPGADLHLPALYAQGSTGADCEKWARGARRRARHAGRPMTIEDLLVEIRGVQQEGSAEKRKVAAVHEAGHALLQALEQPGTLRYASIRQKLGEAGHVAMELPDDHITGKRQPSPALS